MFAPALTSNPRSKATNIGYRLSSWAVFWPDYKWTERIGYSDEEIEMFEELLHSNAHLLYKHAENGGIQILPKSAPKERRYPISVALDNMK